MSARDPRVDPVAFVYHEARLLDEQRWEDWYALFATDGRYWVPLSRTQTDPLAEQAIASEDRLLLKVRVERFAFPRTYSLQSRPACQHVLQLPEVLESDAQRGHFVLRTPFIYVETRGTEQTLLAGTYTHTLRAEGGALRIVTKRVDLVNATEPLPTVFLVI